ncbi:MAG: outer membrane beta-barrel protein [Flammeovirgaceae bacterium]|jgi:hypothetical protein|nr:outer membrane beta-barrel protein [Flammeovirgaceae bacterium]|tara:strand:+ start:16886 stop:17575 length:690 start_codon:yes stop_codon:yes gene_type:complete
MKKRFVFLLAGFVYFGAFAQDENRPKQPDVPGDIMVDFGFSSLMDESQLMDLDFWPSSSFGLYYMMARKVNDYMIFNPSLGFTFERLGFKNQSNYQFDSLKVISWDSISVGDLKKNSLSITYLDLPLELRFYPGKTKNGEGLFVGVGGVFGAKLSSKTKIKYILDGEKRRESNSANFGLSDFRFGLVGRVGFKNINIYAKYYITDVWRNAPLDLAVPSQFTFGINLTGF